MNYLCKLSIQIHANPLKKSIPFLVTSKILIFLIWFAWWTRQIGQKIEGSGRSVKIIQTHRGEARRGGGEAKAERKVAVRELGEVETKCCK